MPRTPQQEAFDIQVKDAPVIKDLTEKVDNLTDGQKDIKESIEEDRKILNEVKKDVDDMKSQIANGFVRLEKSINAHIVESKDGEIKKLNKKLDRKASIKDGVIITLVGGILLVAAVYTLQTLGISIK